MKAAASIIAAGIILLFLPAILLSLDQFRLTNQINPYVVETTAGTSAVVTLSQDLYDGQTADAAVSSNVTSDAPIASSYVAATNALTITGLESNTTHYLTVTYKIDRLNDYFGAAAGARVVPVLLVLGILCIVGGAAYSAFGRGGE